MAKGLFVQARGVSFGFGDGGYYHHPLGYDQDQGTGVTRSHTGEICAGCGKYLDWGRVLYDEMRNKLCFQCFESLYGRRERCRE